MTENINKKMVGRITVFLMAFVVALSFVFIFSGSVEAKYGCKGTKKEKRACAQAVDKCLDKDKSDKKNTRCAKGVVGETGGTYVAATTTAVSPDDGKDTLLPNSQNSTGGCVVDGLKVPVCTKADAEGSDSTGANNPIMVWIGFFVNVLSVVIVAGAAVMMAVAGLQYMTARDKAESVKAAKDKMTSVILGLIAYFFLFAFVQWLVPGGIF